IYFTGGSVGGVMTEGVMCDPRTSHLGAGYGIISASMTDYTASNPPLPPLCPALTGSNPNRNIRIDWIYGTADGIYGNGFDVGRWNTQTPPRYLWSNPALATAILGKDLGCTQTPTTSQTLGNTGKWTYNQYRSCLNANAKTGYYRGLNGGHIPEGYDGLDLAQ